MKIEPFCIHTDDHDIDDLRRRLRETRWSQSLDGAGWEMGMDAAYLRSLSDYWLNQFDWRIAEAALNRLSHFQARSDAGSLHFVHLKGSGAHPIPIVLTHGWPSTFAELLKLGQMLATPSAFGAPASEGFDVVIPSLPGYAFSSAPSPSIGLAHHEIMFKGVSSSRWLQNTSAEQRRKDVAEAIEIGRRFIP
jgi:hypothetical protein